MARDVETALKRYPVAGVGDLNGPGGIPIPEPASWAVMIMGFSSLGALMRDRRRRLPFTSA